VCACLCVCLYVYACVCVGVCVCVCTCAAFFYVYATMFYNIYMFVVYVFVCVPVLHFFPHTYTHIYTHTHTHTHTRTVIVEYDMGKLEDGELKPRCAFVFGVSIYSSIFVCVCVCEREREWVCVCVCVSMFACFQFLLFMCVQRVWGVWREKIESEAKCELVRRPLHSSRDTGLQNTGSLCVQCWQAWVLLQCVCCDVVVSVYASCRLSAPFSSYPPLPNQVYCPGCCAGQCDCRNVYGDEGATQDVEFRTRCVCLCVCVCI